MTAAPPSVIASPFQRYAALIAGMAPGAPAIDLTIGEPRHAVPEFVAPVLAAANADFGRYPPIRGTDAFRAAVADWLGRRYGLATPIDPAAGVLPLNGSRDGLFSGVIHAAHRAAGRLGGRRPAVLIPNPFYAVYAAAAEIAGAEPVMVPATAAGGHLPDFASLPADLLDRTVAAFYASPANPQGATASLADWTALVRLARAHGFMLFADECYSEIWRGAPPAGALQAADTLGDGYAGVVAFNSLSKRSNLPGLRCGFAAGDPDFLADWAVKRNVYGPQVPIPVQAVAVAAYADEDHVAENRRLYDAKFVAAAEILAPVLPVTVPPGGFFLWLDVGALGSGEAIARRLYAEAGVKVLPGAYLAANDPVHGNPGADYIRVAMVEDQQRTEAALGRLAAVLASARETAR
ncbi:aminotransferase class I/II-fold pyridoxal phosphate-dependent enzyme [Methylobrevis albus]|uniref:Aminotransferase class I/II-fold pyridoxal phosphate-dependent enzyme n=1 Tax=Methylobrevis albus TaxID=2793297 RepID=A0A931I303_9HYPH|nr:aminotransferase class I/II-fold pyridoxal phosphate-dependent enzyme [Methylobrevis albus]MBH0237943.1 aminotransferase class I/II-fold pyridoxal phosphate-dependent enzyme [Methylobrevis albus]